VTAPHLTEEELLALGAAFPGLEFDNAECRAVLLESGNRDIQAAPGSGKTTILAAKLYLLARRWTSERSGLCVISHTNTAAREIRERVGKTPEGLRLLSHPHFIGTIHAFANQFLALPRLRSAGVQVDCVDDDVFAAKALRAARSHSKTRFWMEQSPEQRAALVATLSFAGAGLTIASKSGELPKEGGPVGDFLRRLKARLSNEGVFRHDDMLAIAEDVLVDQKRLPSILAARFPLVMLDEMQDTSPRQAALIRSAFGERAVMQRFGDSNQRIFDGGGDGHFDFPRAPFLTMSTSRRFGPAIAEMVSRIREDGPAVVGKGPVSPHGPTVLVYDTARISRVIPFFGELVLARFDDATLAAGQRVRAVCARRTGMANQAPGRHVGDFWPPLATPPADAPPKQANAWTMLGEGPGIGAVPTNLGPRAERARRVVLVALREADSPAAVNVREPWQLFRGLRAREDFDLTLLHKVCRLMAMDKKVSATALGRSTLVDMLHTAVEPLLFPGMTRSRFAALEFFASPAEEADAEARHGGLCHVTVGERSVTVDIDTVAMTKGETHLATLYLESYGLSRRFDIPDVVPLLAGRPRAKGKLPATVPLQRRHVYVGLSRPTDFLCVAVNRERLDGDGETALRDAGWDVLVVE